MNMAMERHELHDEILELEKTQSDLYEVADALILLLRNGSTMPAELLVTNGLLAISTRLLQQITAIDNGIADLSKSVAEARDSYAKTDKEEK